jgi:RNA polymerase sigma-70 factor (ECF subfamily)
MAITIAHRICGNMQDAEDVVQESYLKAYRNLHCFRAESKFSTWLYRIVYNTAVTQTKTQMWANSRETPMEDASLPVENSLPVNLEETERREMVADIIQRMSKGDALLLTLYYMEENPVKEIAGITGLNDSNVKVKLFRARKIFKDLWVKHYRKELLMENHRREQPNHSSPTVRLTSIIATLANL